MTRPRAVLIAALAALLLLALAGCGGGGSGDHAATTPAVNGAAEQVANGPAGSSSSSSSSPSSSSAAAKPAKVPLHADRHAAVPILMYHVIAPAPPGAKYAGLWVAPDALKAQVDALAKAGYTAVTLDAVLDAWEGKPTLPAKPIVLSFDDGYLSQGKDAGPILAARGWPGVLNLAWHNLGTPGGITRTRIKQMIKDGWEIDAHTITHPDLTTLDAAALRREVAGSRQKIQQAFGVPVDAFCYPAGRFDPTVEQAVRAAGYRAATTERPGRATPSQDRYALSRIRVNAGDSAAAVLARVRGA
ncbi:MAG TPA: polysaccharide deacetylase family protein [Baekduia sp.]|uniref:polysaccharide deacetylase family protein n=1 Tax=Baekduia sp. TaxID=2600305 RepID=UPI002D76B9F9|nr:polysaccharide deacetylase family protein [Baekduia sp.]HET6506822.1 polysaccharide deacetylase family protein [Baekduia sp.]